MAPWWGEGGLGTPIWTPEDPGPMPGLLSVDNFRFSSKIISERGSLHLPHSVAENQGHLV